MTTALAIVLGGVDITDKVDFPSLTMQLAGSQETGSCDFDIVDEHLTVTATAESTLSVTEVGSATVLFGGFTRSPRTVLTAVGRLIHVKAFDFNSLLDRSIVVSDSRVAGESDSDRLAYLMGIYGSQFSADYSQIATLNASLPAQKFIAITLRQAIERVLGQASTNSSYYVDATGRLVTYDRTVVTAAPFDIRIGTPGAGELSPNDWSHDRDTDNLANAIYVVGATAAGSGWFTDVTSIATYGRRERFFNAPDSDTFAKAMQVGLAVLEDQKDPVPRAVFTTQSPNDGWRIGQSATVNSVQDDLTDEVFRIAKVTTRYLTPAGKREYTIELGAPQATLSALLGATHGGGGGFPWHSPGGSGGGHLPISSGTPGGGVSGSGGCGCPPFSLTTLGVTETWQDRNGAESFTISRYSGPSDFGPPGDYVDADGTPGADLQEFPFSIAHPSSPYEIETRGFVSHDAPAGATFARFSCRVYGTDAAAGATPLDFAVPVSWAMWSGTWGAGTPAWGSVGSIITSGSVNPDTNGGTTLGDHDSVVDVVVPVVNGRAQFVMAFGPQTVVNCDNGGGMVSQPRYPTFPNSSNQTDDLIATAHPTTFPDSGAFTAKLYTLEYFGGSPAPSRGQVAHTYLTGDGSTTSFTTDFPYSAIRKVLSDGVDVTTDVAATSPSTGGVDFGHAPINLAKIDIEYEGA